MTREEWIHIIDNSDDIMFDVVVNGELKKFTILTWTMNTVGKINIVEQCTGRFDSYYDTAEDLVNEFLVEGIPLGDLAEHITITCYTPFDN